MNKNAIVENAIDLINTEYVKNAVLSLDVRQNKKTDVQRRFYITTAIAAAILLTIVSAGLMYSLKNGNPEPSWNVSNTPVSKNTEYGEDISANPLIEETERTALESEIASAIAETEDTEEPVMSANIIVNRICSEIHAAFPYYSEYAYSYISKDLKALSDYFGKNFGEMTSLYPYEPDAGYSTEFVYTKEGVLVFDVSHFVYEGDSSTVTISVSRIMKPYDCLYQYDSPRCFDMHGVQILLGINTEGTYAAADFESDGTSFRIEMAGSIDLELLVKCIDELIQ